MTSPTKSELDYEDSDDEPSLPLNADPTDAVVEEGEIDSTHTDLTHGPSEVSETRPGSISEPLSPGTARKRGFDEVHRKSQLPVLTTTPQKTPPKSIAFPYRAASEPQAASNPFRQPFEKAGFSALRNVMYAESPPPSTGATVVDRDATQSLTADTEQGQRSFTQEVKSYEQELDNEFREFEKQLESRDRSAELVALDWDDLERRFTNAIDPLVAEEDKIRQELGHRLQQFLLWMQVSGEKESERAFKRLRTRTAFVQQSEAKLGEKQDHYRKVVEAFETAMRLLTVANS